MYTWVKSRDTSVPRATEKVEKVEQGEQVELSAERDGEARVVEASKA